MERIAEAVLAAIGGRQNVLTNTVCMTRLRVTLRNPQDVDYEALNNVPSVLGTATRGANGLEVVFGPRVIDGIYHAFLRLTGIEAGSDALFPMSRQETNFRVLINPSSRSARPSAADRTTIGGNVPRQTTAKPLDDWDSDHLDQSDIDTLKSLFDEDEQPEQDAPQATTVSTHVRVARNPRNLLVINGPNVNLIGLGIVTNDEVIDLNQDEKGAAAAKIQEIGRASCRERV